MTVRQTGTVTTDFENRSFGFITSDVDGISRFFHYTNYKGTPELGVRVEFELAPPTKIGKDKQCVKIIPIAEAIVQAAQDVQKGGTAATPKAGA